MAKTKPTCVIRNESCKNSAVATCSAKSVSGCALGKNDCSRERETGDEEALGRWRGTRYVWRRKYGCREHITKRWPMHWRLSRANILTDVAVMTPPSEMTLSMAWEVAGSCEEPYVEDARVWPSMPSYQVKECVVRPLEFLFVVCSRQIQK